MFSVYRAIAAGAAPPSPLPHQHHLTTAPQHLKVLSAVTAENNNSNMAVEMEVEGGNIDNNIMITTIDNISNSSTNSNDSIDEEEELIENMKIYDELMHGNGANRMIITSSNIVTETQVNSRMNDIKNNMNISTTAMEIVNEDKTDDNSKNEVIMQTTDSSSCSNAITTDHEGIINSVSLVAITKTAPLEEQYIFTKKRSNQLPSASSKSLFLFEDILDDDSGNDMQIKQ